MAERERRPLISLDTGQETKHHAVRRRRPHAARLHGGRPVDPQCLRDVQEALRREALYWVQGTFGRRIIIINYVLEFKNKCFQVQLFVFAFVLAMRIVINIRSTITSIGYLDMSTSYIHEQCSYYCSRECQVKHWKNGHKKMCPALQTIMDGYESSPVSRKMVEAMKEEDLKNKNKVPGEDQLGLALYSEGMDLVLGAVRFLEDYPDAEPDPDETKKDPEKGYRLIREAAEMGCKGAQYTLSIAYLEGEYFFDKCSSEEANFEKIKWIKMAAENGHAEACVTYCKFWYQGDFGHPKDLGEAMVWLRRGMVRGVGDGLPDPYGDVLSEDSFEKSHQMLMHIAREAFLYKYATFLHDGEPDKEREEKVWLSADCGIGAALMDVQTFGAKERPTGQVGDDDE